MICRWCWSGRRRARGLDGFAEPWLLVLTSLSDGPKHGYAIMTDVAAFSGVQMEPGHLVPPPV